MSIELWHSAAPLSFPQQAGEPGCRLKGCYSMLDLPCFPRHPRLLVRIQLKEPNF